MKSTFFKYFILCAILILITEATKYFLQFDKLLYNTLAENLTSDQIENFFNLQKKWQWVSYLFVPIFILLKTSIIASVVYIGTFFFNKNDITFKNILNCVIQAEFIFLLVPVLKIIWFYFFQTNYTLEDIQYFYPLSALNITGYQGLDPWLIYPLQVLNLFELAYIIYLSYQIGQLTQTNTDNGLKIVAYSYVPALFLWVTAVMFFTLNYS
jgi:hypothetical protein